MTNWFKKKWQNRKKKGKTPPRIVGSAKQDCPLKLTASMTIYVRYKRNGQPVGGITVKVTGPTPWTKQTTPKLGMAHQWPVKDGTYKINIMLPPNLLTDYELVPEHTAEVPANSKYSHTFYIVRKPRLKVRVLGRRPQRLRTQQNPAEWEVLDGVTVLPLELAGRVTPGAPGWADFGVVKPGKYHPTVPNWGKHGTKYELIQADRAVEANVAPDEVVEVTLHAARTGWIEFEVKLDKPKTGERAELQSVRVTTKVPTNVREGPFTTIHGVARIEELDPGNCDIEGLSYEQEPLEYVSG
ncbi:MAG TPA: hypothetical protein VNE39_18310 [Planctomycetota bacterium]|nr:hypothetical protein [Planctomycetota bacterium]